MTGLALASVSRSPKTFLLLAVHRLTETARFANDNSPLVAA